jgi:hypothetical protein
VNTKTLSNRALSVIDQYLHFKAGQAVCSVPYFNNKTVGARGALSVYVGKGSPKEIFDEVQSLAVKNHIDMGALTDESSKKLLVDNNIGIDCSGFSYYILNAESEELGKNSLGKHLKFIHAHGIFGRFLSALNPVKNTDVETLADDKNSHIVSLKDLRPGDMITMTKSQEVINRNHILVIHQVEYQNFIPIKIHYSHVIAYPEDGIYGTGVKQGIIEIMKPEAGLLEQNWNEDGLAKHDPAGSPADRQGKEVGQNRIFVRTQRSKTELRRLKWL